MDIRLKNGTFRSINVETIKADTVKKLVSAGYDKEDSTDLAEHIAYGILAKGMALDRLGILSEEDYDTLITSELNKYGITSFTGIDSDFAALIFNALNLNGYIANEDKTPLSKEQVAKGLNAIYDESPDDEDDDEDEEDTEDEEDLFGDDEDDEEEEEPAPVKKKSSKAQAPKKKTIKSSDGTGITMASLFDDEDDDEDELTFLDDDEADEIFEDEDDDDDDTDGLFDDDDDEDDDNTSVYLFYSKDSARVNKAKDILDDSDVDYDVITSSNDKFTSMVEKYGISKSPSVVIESDGGVKLLDGFDEIKKHFG